MGDRQVRGGPHADQRRGGRGGFVPLVAPVEVGLAAPTPEQHALAEFTGIRDDVDAGLTRVFKDTPVGHGYVEALGGLSPAGAFARLEAGYHPLDPVALFAAGQVDSIGGARAEVGAKVKF